MFDIHYSNAMNTLFPIFLKAHELNILIVGGGEVGAEKLFFLLKSSPEAKVRLIAELLSDEVKEIAAKHPQVELVNRLFEPTDLEGVEVLILATGSREESARIRILAKQTDILVNVADTPDLCDFYLSSIVTKGDLKIAISTNGKSPTLAKRMREMFEEILPDDIDELLTNLRNVRDQLKGDFKEKVKRLNEITSSFKL